MVGRGSRIDQKLMASRGDRLRAVAQLPDPDLGGLSGPEATQTLQHTATQAQQAVESFARDRAGVRIRNQFWITNAVVLDIDTSQVPLEEIARVPEIRRLHDNSEVEALDGTAGGSRGTTASLSHGETTYGLDQVDAPEVWTQFGTRGEGATVAVLDTGVDPDHPDIDLAEGGFQEFDEDGLQVDSSPYDTAEHGTHVTGTVAGGDASGEHIGVAPNVELLHGLVLPDNFGTYAQIIAGIEWAVEEGADVINLSLGAEGQKADYIAPLQNAKDAGAVPVCAIGNDGETKSRSPGNVYGAGIAVGASDATEGIDSDSGGEKIVTDDAWGSDAPDDWPDEYVVPDVAAPGVDVTSSLPGGGYGQKSGTSMAAPHVAGLVALLVSVSDGSVTPAEVRSVLESTAWKPDSWDESDASASIDGKDTRYGKGIVDATAAASAVAPETGIEGFLQRSGTTQYVEGATLDLDGALATTDEDGAFERRKEPGTYTLEISGPGIETTTKFVTVEDSGDVTNEGTIDVDPVVDLYVTEQPVSRVEGGDTISVTLDAYNLETFQVDLAGTYSQDDATLTVDGTSVAFGESVAFDEYTGEVAVAVETTADTSGEVSLEYTASGAGTETTISTGPTSVYDTLVTIGVVDASDTYGAGIVETLESNLAAFFTATRTTASDVANKPGDYDAVVVQKFDSLPDGFFDATADDTTGVVYLDQWDDDANGIETYRAESDAVSNPGQGTNDGPPAYELTADHPVFDGVSADAPVDLHDADSEDYTTFEVTDPFEALATVLTDSESQGTGFAIDEGSQTVLAGGLGRSQYVPEDAFTDAANTILANAAAYVAVDTASDSLSLVATGATGVSPGGQGQLAVDALNAASIELQDVWTDWSVADVVDDGATFDDTILSDTGTCSFDWGGPRASSTPSLTLSLPDRYVGGEYVLTVRATRGNESAETTVSLSVE